MLFSEEISGGVTLITVQQKRATAEIAREFKDFLFALIERQDVKHFVIELESVQFMDSFFLGAIVSGLKKCRSQSGDIRLVNVQPSLLPVIQLMHLDEVFKIFNSRQEAIASFS